MNDKLSTWIAKELENRGWSHRELARRAGVSQTAVSQAISEERRVGWDFCAAIAPHLGKTPEEVLRLAGLLPPLPEPATGEENLLTAYRRMSPGERGVLLRFMGTWHEQQSPIRPIESGVIDLSDNPAPDMEDIANLAGQLDEFERRLVYDYARWRLIEQERRRNSTGKRHKPDEARRQEIDEVIAQIDLYLAVNEATPKQREDFIFYLIERYKAEQAGEKSRMGNAEPSTNQQPT